MQERICFLSPWLHLTPSDAEPVGSIPFKLEPLNGVRGQVVAVGWGGGRGRCVWVGQWAGLTFIWQIKNMTRNIFVLAAAKDKRGAGRGRALRGIKSCLSGVLSVRANAAAEPAPCPFSPSTKSISPGQMWCDRFIRRLYVKSAEDLLYVCCICKGFLMSSSLRAVCLLHCADVSSPRPSGEYIL